MNTTLHIAGIEEESIVDGPGIRNVVFWQGCLNRCQGCHNPHTWDIGGGEFVDVLSLLKKWKENPLVDGVTFSGGDSFHMLNMTDSEFLARAEYMHECSELAVKLFMGNLISYTGYSLSDLMHPFNILSQRYSAKAADYMIYSAGVVPSNQVEYIKWVIDWDYYQKSSLRFKYWVDLLCYPRYIFAEPFIEDKKSIEFPYRGSSNQTVLSFRKHTLSPLSDMSGRGCISVTCYNLTRYWDKTETIVDSDNFLKLFAPSKFSAYLENPYG